MKDWDAAFAAVKEATESAMAAMEAFAQIWHETTEGHAWVDERPLGHITLYKRCSICREWKDFK